MQLQTRIRSTAAGFLSSKQFADLLQRIARGKRVLSGSAPTVHYFHQVNDPITTLNAYASIIGYYIVKEYLDERTSPI